MQAGLIDSSYVVFYVLGVLVFAVALPAIIGVLLLGHSKQRVLEKEEQRTTSPNEYEARSRAILSALPDLMLFELDDKGTYLDWYAAESSALCAPPERFLGKNMRDILPAELADRFDQHFRHVLSSGEPATLEYSLTIHNEPKFFEARILKWGDDKILSIVRNLTEKKQAQMELRELSSLLLKLQDEERQRIARELHDITAQNLFAITVQLENLRLQRTYWPNKEKQVLDECQRVCELSLQEVRTLSYLFHPPTFGRLDFISALKSYLDGFARRSGLDVGLYTAQNVGRLAENLETDLFRVVQEALYNVFRHSGSERATIFVETQGDEIVMRIRVAGPDRGTSEAENGAPFGIGMPGMRERLRRWGGHLEVESAHDGVLLVARVPLRTVEL